MTKYLVKKETLDDLADAIREQTGDENPMKLANFASNVRSISGGSHTYSTTEQEVGTWIDGSTVYEKTIQFESDIQITNNTWTVLSDYDSLAQTIDKVIASDGYFYSSAGGGSQPIAMQLVSGHLQVQLARFYSPSNISLVTIRYTKIST